LIAVHRIHFNVSFIVGTKLFSKTISQQICLLRIGRNDGNASLSR
jgi:hypothetical protein